jgi:EmrB/QacA subfamily drug resistance transporter
MEIIEQSVATREKFQPNRGRRLHGFTLISVLCALMLTLLLEALDQTVVGTAMPKIIGELHGFDRYTWVVTAYLLASTAVIPVAGKLSDQFGRKWFFVIGVIVFLAGSVLSGAAQTINQLILFRAIQGFGAGIGIALVPTVLGDIFPPAEQAKWQGIFGAVYGISSVIGPTLGGWLSDHGPLLGTFITDVSRWRWVFYVNLPLGILALIAIFVYLPRNISVRSNSFTGMEAVKRIDFAGAFLAACATISLLLGLTWASNGIYTWGSKQVVGALILSGILYFIFLIVERFAVEPILPLILFKNRVFTADALLGITSGMALLGLVIYLPLFLQGVLGASATYSGEVITPLTVSMVLGAMLAGVMIAKLGKYQVITVIGSLLLIIGTFLLTQLTETTAIHTAFVDMAITGIGLGIFFPILDLAVINALPQKMKGVGVGSVNYLRALGQTVGVAIVGTVVNHTVSHDILGRISAATASQLTPQGLKAVTNPQVLISPSYHDSVVQTVEKMSVHGAVAKAVKNVPPGPFHNQGVAAATKAVTTQVTAETHAMLGQVFTALKHSLALAIQHGIIAILIFSAGVFVASILLKDIPLAKQFRD